jgi:superfamily II DNA or RNA helicase
MDIWDHIEASIDARSLSYKPIITPLKKQVKPVKPVKQPCDKINITVTITRAGTYIENLSSELLRKIQNYYTLSDKTIMGYFKKTPNWNYSRNKLYIPRFGAFLLTSKFNVTFTNQIIPQNPLPDLTYTGKFSGNQELIFNDIIANKFNVTRMQNGKSGLILNLQAGMGKTFLAMSLIGELKCRTLIVCHNSSIMDQWVKLITEYFPGTSVGQYYSKKKTLGDITVGIINSLIMDEIKLPNITTPREFYDKFDFVIFDEAHEYCSATRSQIYKVAQCPYMLGLSATPNDRGDTLDKINHWGCGSVYDASLLPGYTTKEISFKGRVTKICYSGPPDYTETILNEKLDLVSVPLMIGQLCADPYRLAMIIDLIIEQHKAGLNILVFADRRSYLETIRVELEKKSLQGQMMTDDTEYNNITGIAAMRLVGGSTSQEMDLAKEKKNIILTTYQYFGTGTSIPKLNAVILTTPRKSKSRQFVGRIFRLGSNYEIERQIIDITDMRTTLKNQWQSRVLYYKEQNYTIVDRKISYKTYE